MLSAATARLVEGVAALGAPELVDIKGADEPVPAHRLLAVGQQDRAPQAQSNLVGRRWEMGAVEGLLDRAVNGRGAVVSIVGPPGIGKSRLTRELSSLAGKQSVAVFSTFCESHTTQVPFQVVARLLRSAVGIENVDAADARALVESDPFAGADPGDVALFEDLLGIADPGVEPPKIDADARRRRLTAMVNAATLANQKPAVYVIEDAHWIDESSEAMLAEFLTVVPQTPILTVITYRPEYKGALAQVPGAQTIALAPLSDSETRTLVTELLGSDPSVRDVGQVITERASGTPFFAEEMVRDLAERGVFAGPPGAYTSATEATEVTVPATLHATIAARIDRLDSKAKRTLSAAAVIGSRFDLPLLTALGVEPAVDDLLAAQLVDQVDFTRHPEYTFHHPLIRTVAYETQLRSDRAELHRRLAAAMQQDTGTSVDENAALIAEHLEAAGDLDSAYDWHMRAGGWSLNRDSSAARASWERARRVADAVHDAHPNRTPMRIAPRSLLIATGWRVHANDSSVRFSELRELCAAADDKVSLAIGMSGHAAAYMQRAEMLEASQLAGEHLALVESIGDPGLAFGGMLIKAQVAEMDTAMDWAQTIIDWADGDPTKGNLVVGSPLAAAYSMRGLCRWWFGRSGWREDIDESVRLARTADALTLAVVVAWRGGVGRLSGVLRAEEELALVNLAVQTAEESGDDYAVDMAQCVLGSVLLDIDDDNHRDRGVELLTRNRELCLRQRYPMSELALTEFELARERFRRDVGRDEAIRTMRESLDSLFDRRQLTYAISATRGFVDALLERGTGSDITDAGAATERLADLDADGSVIRDLWLLHCRALVAHARRDTSYPELRDRYREKATSLDYAGHMAWAEAMP